MINGLVYEDNFITDKEEKDLIEFINSQKWLLKIYRIQNYGFEYTYGIYDKLAKAPDIPSEFGTILEKINKKFNKNFNQLIIYEYKQGQGTHGIKDDDILYGDTTVIINLGAVYPMVFLKDKVPTIIEIKNRSMVALTGDARYKYKYAFPPKKYDNAVLRGIQIKLTFREVK